MKSGKFIKELKPGQVHLALAGERIGNGYLIIVNLQHCDEMTIVTDTDPHQRRLSRFRRKCRAKHKMRGETATAYVPRQIPGLRATRVTVRRSSNCVLCGLRLYEVLPDEISSQACSGP